MKDFFAGFEKRAVSVDAVAIGAGIGTIAGLTAHALAARAAQDAIKNDPETQPSKGLIKKYKRFAPDVTFLTESDMRKLESGKKALPKEKALASSLRNMVSGGQNAFFYRSPGIGEPAKQYIGVGDKVSPSVIGHEIGHYLSHKEIEGLPTLEQLKRLSTLSQEEEAWEKSPVKSNPELKEKALKSYRSMRYPLYGLLGGGALGLLVDAMRKG